MSWKRFANACQNAAQMPTEGDLQSLTPRFSEYTITLAKDDQAGRDAFETFTRKKAMTPFDTLRIGPGVQVNASDCVFVGLDQELRDVWACLAHVPDSSNRLYCYAPQRAAVVLLTVSRVWRVVNLEVEVTSFDDMTVEVVPVCNLDNIAFDPSITGTTIADKYRFLYDALTTMAYFIYDQVD